MQLPLGVVVSTGSASAVGSIFLYPKLTSPGALYLNTAPASSGVSGSIVVDTGAGGGTGTAGQIQIGPTNTSGVAIGGASGTLGLVGIGGANTSTNPDILQVKAVPTGHSGIELAYTNSALGYGSVDFFDTTTPAYEWAIGAAPSSYSDTKLTGPKFFIRKGPVGAPTYPLVVDTSGHVGIGPQAPSAFLDVSGPVSAAPSATIGVYQNFAASTLTDNATAGSGTAPGATFNAIQIPTLAATNTSVITTNAYTLQILGAPLAGNNEMLTNSTAFNIASNALIRTTNGFGLQVHAPSGAMNNYAATFLGGGLGIGTSEPLAPLDTRRATNEQGTIYARRATDTAPAGNFVQFQNNAGSATAFSVDVNGNMAVNGSASLQGGLILKRATTTGSAYPVASDQQGFNETVVSVLELPAGKAKTSFPVYSIYGFRPASLAVSPDGLTLFVLFSAFGDGSVGVCNANLSTFSQIACVNVTVPGTTYDSALALGLSANGALLYVPVSASLGSGYPFGNYLVEVDATSMTALKILTLDKRRIQVRLFQRNSLFSVYQ